MVERKRKRELGKHERSSKKTATDEPEIAPVVRISMVPDIGEWCPVVGEFPKQLRLNILHSTTASKTVDYTDCN
jgi:hypothetical protein